METSLPTPMTARVYVNLPEGITFQGVHVQSDALMPLEVGDQKAIQLWIYPP